MSDVYEDAGFNPAAEPEPLPERGIEVPGGEFVFDESQWRTPPVWGDRRAERIIWPSGEPLMIAASPGLGKTTIAQQVALARIRGGGDVLGHWVRPTDKCVLYVAADRPKQAARSLRRMVTDEERETLNEGLIVWPGPISLTELPELCAERHVDTVFLDTLGALVPNLASDESGQYVYHALQKAMAAGLEVCLLHHTRKRGDTWRGADEVYGSRWITAVAGSVMLLRGKAGSDTVELDHAKQPAESLGEAEVYHDHRRGMTFLEGHV